MIQRRGTAVVLMSLGVLALAGCSEPVTGGTGLLVDDGRVQAVVQMCPDATASGVNLTKAAGSNYFWEQTSWEFDSAAYAKVDLGPVDEFLERIGDKRMQLQSNASHGVGGSVDFEAADIRGLRDGEILSNSWSDYDPEVFDGVGFVNEALMYCPGG